MKQPPKLKKLRITKQHREILSYYLKEFYKRYPSEKFTIFHFVKFFKLRLKNKKDAWIGLSGETGIGKSYFVLMVMTLFGRPATLEDNVSYLPTGQEIVNKLGKLRRNIFLVDEAAFEMRAVNWQSKAQQKVNVKAMTDRFHENMVVLNMPNFKEFTKSMRRGNLQFRIIALYRTPNYVRFVVQRKSRNWRSEDPWGDDLAMQKYEKVQKKYGEITNDHILDIERSLPSTVMDFIIPDFSIPCPDLAEEYERLKRESREVKDEAVEEAKSNPYKDKYEKLMAKITKLMVNNTLGIGKVKVTRSEMADALGVSTQVFRKYFKRQVKPIKQKGRFKA